MHKVKVQHVLWLILKITWIPAFLTFAIILGLIAGYGFIMAQSIGQHRSLPTIIEMGKGILNREIWDAFIQQILDLN